MDSGMKGRLVGRLTQAPSNTWNCPKHDDKNDGSAVPVHCYRDDQAVLHT
jgi:hypothetical protein